MNAVLAIPILVMMYFSLVSSLLMTLPKYLKPSTSSTCVLSLTICMITHNISIKYPKQKTLAKQVIKLRNSNSQGHLDPLMVFEMVKSY
jgi:uncharacterized membrane protein